MGQESMPEIENAAEAVQMEEAEPTQESQTAAIGDDAEPTPEPEAKETKGEEKPKRPEGLDRLMSRYPKAAEEKQTEEPAPKPGTAEARIHELTSEVKRLRQEADGLRAQRPQAPDLAAFDAKELVRSIDLKGMDDEDKAYFQETTAPALAQMASLMFDKYVTPLQDQIAKQGERFSQVDQAEFTKEFEGYMGDAWDDDTKTLAGQILRAEGADVDTVITQNPRMAAIWTLGVRAMYGMERLEGMKEAQEAELRRQMATTETTPSGSAMDRGDFPSDAPHTILTDEQLREHRVKHGHGL